jgi:WD40 repeat protein
VIVGCGDGGLLLGDLKYGTITWTKKAAETGLRFVYDVSFSGDAKSLVAADDQGRVHVFETSTGKRTASVGFGPMESSVMSAALSPDGSKGAFVELSGRVFTFDVASGAMRDTGATGAWPVRFTADGRYFALRSANSGLTEQLRVVDAADTTLTKDLGQLMLIGRIRPSADGTLSLTGVVKNGNTSGQKSVGLTCDPRTGEMRTVWESGAGWIDRGRTAFDAEAVRGVSTDYRLVTSVIDLKTDTAVLTVDNSANFRPTVASWTLVLQIWPLLTAGACVVVAVVVLVRRRRHASVTARAAA